MNLDILFLGRMFPREAEAQIKSKMKTGMQDAANALQWNIIDGLEANNCGKIKILNYLPIDSYPKGYTDRNIEEFVFQHTDKYQADDINVGCTNLTVFKQFCNVAPFKRKIKDWIRKDNGCKKVLMLYTASAMFLELSRYTKKMNPQIETCCIIADLPAFSALSNTGGINKMFNNYLAQRSFSLLKNVDKVVLLTKQMSQKLDIKVPFTVVEGISTCSDVLVDQTFAQKYTDDKYLLYSGTLNYRFGIGTLVEAFSKMKDLDVKLIICGFGEAEERIREKQKTDDRIVFLGRVDRKQVLALQRNATVLVNHRQNNEEFTKYSFPSKNLEYLSAGVPVVAYKLDGIPDEYDEYLFYPDNDEVESLTLLLEKLCRMDSQMRKELGQKGMHFVQNRKNAESQTEKILDLLYE